MRELHASTWNMKSNGTRFELNHDKRLKTHNSSSSSNSWFPQVTDLEFASQDSNLIYFATRTSHFGRVDVRQGKLASSTRQTLDSQV